MFDQESVVLPVEVDILEKLLLAHLLSLLIKIGFKKCASPHICMPSPVPPAEKKLSSETSEEDTKNLVNYREGIVRLGFWPSLVRQAMPICKRILSIFREGLQVEY